MMMINRQNHGVDAIQIEVYRVLRERFAPFAGYSGPLFAGIYVHQGIAGGFYIDQQKQWLWLPDTAGRLRPEDAILSDEAGARQQNGTSTKWPNFPFDLAAYNAVR